MVRIPRFSFAAVAVAIALAGACGGDDKTASPESGSETTTTTAPPATNPGETTVPVETSAPSGTEVPVDASGISRDHLHLKYTATGDQAGEIEVGVLGSKISMRAATAGQNQMIIVDGSTATVCAWSDQAPQCTKVDGGGDTYGAAIEVFLDPLGSNGPLTGAENPHDVDGRQLAGRTTKCTVGTLSGEETELCIDDQLSVLAYTKTGTAELSLTELSGDVADSLFELPPGATITDS